DDCQECTSPWRSNGRAASVPMISSLRAFLNEVLFICLQSVIKSKTEECTPLNSRAPEYGGGSIGEDLRAEHDVGLGGVLRPVVADALETRDEHHSGATPARQDLRVVARAARHPQMAARRVALGRRLDLRLKPGIHRRRHGFGERRDRRAAWAGIISFLDQLMQCPVER